MERGEKVPENTPPAPPWHADRLVSIVLPEHDCRLLLTDASGTAVEAEFRHLSGRVSAEVLARATVAAILLGADLKDDERLSIQARCEGRIEGWLVEVDSKLNFRGYTTKKTIRGL